jgi:excisionase family DNA binding protein
MPTIKAKQASRQEASTIDKLTIAETAMELRSSTDFVRDEIRKRRLASIRLGWRYFVVRRDLEAYLERARTAALGERRTTAK